MLGEGEGGQRVVSTQIRHRNLLRLNGVYIPRGKPTILSKIAIQFYLHVWGVGGGGGGAGTANYVYPDQTPQLVAPVYTPRGKPTILSKTAIQIYLHVGKQRKTASDAAICCA